ncbi:MAG: hypothetical protein WCY15_06130 [Phenylobacterium sp.]|nr:hypothetical protein [Phenylobacterium sp.]MDX9996831.1 hypothetical protein [Phenylobacterium sp.]
MLGKGKRFFGDGARPLTLKHTGTFEFDTPSEAELARREKMKREG